MGRVLANVDAIYETFEHCLLYWATCAATKAKEQVSRRQIYKTIFFVTKEWRKWARVEGSKANGCLEQVFNFKLGSFATFHIKYITCIQHSDRTRASTLCCCFINLFFSFEHVKSLLIMGPNNTKN